MAKNNKKAKKKNVIKTKPTGKEIDFCEYYVTSHNAAESYRRAYDSKSLDGRTKGYELRQKGYIGDYIAHLQFERAMKMKMTADDIFEEIQKMSIDPTVKDKNRLSALQLLGKTHKMFIDKVELDATHKHTGKSEAEIMEELNKLKDKRKYDEL